MYLRQLLIDQKLKDGLVRSTIVYYLRRAYVLCSSTVELLGVIITTTLVYYCIHSDHDMCAPPLVCVVEVP